MRQPTDEQLAQLRQLRTYSRVVEYLKATEQAYIDRLISETDDVAMRRLQGSLYTVRKLLDFILS